jgi:hypothetical protein
MEPPPRETAGRVPPSLLSLDGNPLVVGARWADTDIGVDVGAVFVYGRDHQSGEWVLVQNLRDEDGKNADRFGQSVALLGQRLVVGARDADADDRLVNTGAVFFHELDRCTAQWSLAERITPDDGVTGGQFGFSLALSAQRLVMGARRAGTGAVYLYEHQSFGSVDRRFLLVLCFHER